ncbi:SusC/RagA family TonB-linked outer membrane protein [Maribellus comscasis]|uniref:SusC/RagA family TonB-linked outer membrane protein n=1 Tax=Maribellus comscasis TaxID=2681766 RepID=A0A6I6JQQ5_9BACT|nr:TonB-dependent receptor [Maribellus comscasis]QGY43499.1 SusC/RagA family TonB-linked outer membrane protein [Maribellus comscasis]
MKKNDESTLLNSRSVKKLLLTMKLTFLLLLIGLMQVSASVYSQSTRFSFDLSDTKVVDVLKEIESKSEFRFFYQNEQIDVERKVNISVSDKTVEEILNELFNGYSIEYKIFSDKLILLGAEKAINNAVKDDLTSPQNTVSGTVTDEAGIPLPGVTVVVKGTTQGTVTNVDGYYSLPNVPAEATLQFSFVGMITQEVVVGNQSSINIQMETDAIGIEEVVAVGYSSKKVSELSSAVSVVKEKDLRGVTSSNLGTMLQGKVPGVRISNTTGRPGQDPQIVIRGVGSMGAGYSPLFVVDGIIGGTYNPEDIETITVLKDAAASGLYGSRAANGVVVITTKSGKKGKTVVRFNSSYGMSYHNDGNMSFMNAQELFDYHRTAATNSYSLLDNPSQSLEDFLEERIPSSYLDYQTNWQALLKRTGQINKHQVSVSGGDEKTTFYLSANYYKELGTMINMEYERMDMRANFKHKISEIFDLSFRVALGKSENPNEPQGGQEGLYMQYHMAMPFDRPYDDNGDPIDPYDPNVNWYGNSKSNYFYNREHYTDNTKRLNMSSDVQLDVKIADWVTFSTSNRVGVNGTDHTQVFDKYHFLAKSEGGIAFDNIGYTGSVLTSNKFNFKKQVNEHQFKGILGQEYSYSKYKYVSGEGMDLPYGLSAISATGSPKSVGGSQTEVGFKSYFAQFDYSFRSKYYLVASYRNDASSRFGKDNRWGSFYAIGTSWVVNQENFLKDKDWLDQLKLKLSYGSTGNANISDYLSLSSYSFNNSYAGNAAAIPARMANPDLTWEVAYTTNIGIEMSVLKRFQLALDFYNRDNKDLLQDVPLSAATGFSSQQRNIGEVRNRGLDFTLTSKNIQGEFEWITSLNMNFNRSKILKLNDGEDILDGNMRFSEGRALRYWYMKEWAGVDSETGQPLWVRWEDADGNKIDQSGGTNPTVPANITTTSNQNEASLLFIESPYPDFTGGIRNDFSYKGFSLSIFADFSHGNTIYSAIRGYLDSDGAYTWHNKMKMQSSWTRWEKPGDKATHPQLLYNGNNNSYTTSSRYIEDASYLRIQNITLGYDFNKKLAFFSNVRVQMSLDNLLTFTKFSGADPSMNMENPSNGQNSNTGGYAPTKKVMFGISFDL